MPPQSVDSFLSQLKEKKDTSSKDRERLTDLEDLVGGSDNVQRAVIETTRLLINYLAEATLLTKVTNQKDFPKSIATPDVSKVVKAVEDLRKVTADKNVDLSPILKMGDALTAAIKSLPQEIPKAE